MTDRITPTIAVVPLDTAEAREAMKRVQIAMWVDGVLACCECKHVFESVDDFIERNPRYRGRAKDDRMIVSCDKCWKPKKKRAGK